MKDRILQTLATLRDYSRERGHEIALEYHEEDSYLMRFANSAISLNTNEHLIRLQITAYSGKKRANNTLITELNKTEEMKQAIEVAAQMVEHSQPLDYTPTIPVYEETFVDESGYNQELARLGNRERLAFFDSAVEGLETDELRLSGIFSCGANTMAMTNTRSNHSLFFRTSDAQVTAVLAHRGLKWEIIAEQSAQSASDLAPARLRQDLRFLVDLYQSEKPRQLPLGSYDIVFGPAATAEMISIMNWIGFDGGLMKRGYSFLSEDQVGQKVFSDRFTLVDDPCRHETYPFKRDFAGMVRERHPVFENGVFQGFLWQQDDADEFNAKPTGHSVPHKSLSLHGGDGTVGSVEELVEMARPRATLYIPFLHYMNIVNPSKGVVTASSRFGALLLNEDGSVDVPYNVRITQSLLDIFGDRLDWLSRRTTAYNTSHSYGARNPTAVIVPLFVRVNDIEISHSNTSY